ncbi:hypothetical protein [Chryseobacterium gambrini]|uniref:hypothetical protein n=1 Tax=Chryseobacterium gambrini TaxID=373672 RepID=UPI003D13BA30
MSEIEGNNKDKADQAAYELGKRTGKDFSNLTPSFIKELMSIKSDAPILEGIRQGYADYIKEQKEIDTSRLPDWMQSGRLEKAFNEKSQYPDREKDKGNEPER